MIAACVSTLNLARCAKMAVEMRVPPVLQILGPLTKKTCKVDQGTPTSLSPPAQQHPQGFSITVPKPCFVSMTEAKEAHLIEFIDQISFVNGITWHRTYRELSPDGKVLNSCRAIYDGCGGVSQDRGSAWIYVGSQDWEHLSLCVYVRGASHPWSARLSIPSSRRVG